MAHEPSTPICVLEVVNPNRVPRTGEPVTVGVPLPRAAHRDPDTLRLIGQDSKPVPCQFAVLERWSDGSIRWILLDFRATCGPGGSRVTLAAGGSLPESTPTVLLEESNGIVVDTGAARFELGTRFPFDVVTHRGRSVLDGQSGLEIELERGPAAPRIDRAVVEERGHLRTTVRLDATAFSDGRALLVVTGRLRFVAGLPLVRLDVTLQNPQTADHPGGFWELGAASSVLLKDVSLTLALAVGESAPVLRASLEHGDAMRAFPTPFLLHQDSSGGEHWDSRAHVNRHGRVPMQFRGYRVTSPSGVSTGLRAAPVVAIETADNQLATAAEHFWQNCPKAISADGRALRFGLFPAEHADLHELQGGEQKTHTLWLAVGRDPITEIPLDWCRAPLMVRADPKWYAQTEAVSYLTPASEDPHAAYLALVSQAIEGADTFASKRERIDEYGWRHFGDIYADHEDVFAPGPHPIVSHYNNQYDAIGGFASQFMRSGDHRWWMLMREMARHVVDIDLYHATNDKSAYNGGQFWHTYHYRDAGLSTHRSYPKGDGVSGGGPSPEQNYSTGLLLSYFLTGERDYRDAVLSLAEWVIAMDDGRLTLFRWLDAGPTGLASATGSPSYHGPGRGPGNSIVGLLNAYRLSGDRRFDAKAEELLRRCVHPAMDIPALDLLDAERRWYYTVFLQAIGRFLDDRAERGNLGAAYQCAEQVLLAFSRWMAEHEYPYLDRPQKLEYPTETWAAQDMRKSEVFDLAAMHSRDGPEKERFQERSAFFFESSTLGLRRSATRTLTRPVVLMLSYGFRRAWFRAHPKARANQPEGVEEASTNWTFFHPQKARAYRRLRKVALAFGVVALLAFLAMLANVN